MFFYKVQINSLPRIRFACSTTTDQYKNIFDNRKNLLEISTCYGVGIRVESKNDIQTIPARSLTVFMPDMQCKTFAADEGELRTNSIAMEIEDLNFARIDETEVTPDLLNELFRDENTLLLPFTMPLDNGNLEITNIIQKIISEYIKNNATGHYRCLSLWFELLAVINSEFRNHLFLTNHCEKIQSSFYYVKKAKNYISNNYCKHIQIADIAAELGITKNYLSQMFKEETGKTIIEFVNILRAQKVRELSFDGNNTLEHIAEQVGLHNVRYMQRMFKKNFGISIQECRRIDNEISLYHTKPWNVDELNKDLMRKGK